MYYDGSETEETDYLNIAGTDHQDPLHETRYASLGEHVTDPIPTSVSDALVSDAGPRPDEVACDRDLKSGEVIENYRTTECTVPEKVEISATIGEDKVTELSPPLAGCLRNIKRVKLRLPKTDCTGIGSEVRNMANGPEKATKKNKVSWSQDTGKMTRGLPLKETYPQAPDAQKVCNLLIFISLIATQFLLSVDPLLHSVRIRLQNRCLRLSSIQIPQPKRKM